MKRILIYTVTAGSGHNTIAKTLQGSLIAKYGGEVEIKIVDLFKDYKSKFKAFVIDDGYRFSVKYLRPAYNYCFKKKQKCKPVKRNTIGVSMALAGKYDKILCTLEQFKPNYIFCTHFLPAIALTNLKKRGLLNIPFGTMITDYVVCPYIEHTTGADKILIPCDKLKEDLLKIGFKESQILTFGFPAKIEKCLNFEKCEGKTLTLLIMSGAGSFSGLTENIKQLLKADLNIKIVFINGKNSKQRCKIQKLIDRIDCKNTEVENYGFVDNEFHYQLLQECDIIVTKCGANSLLEALNLGKVVVTTEKLAEQELQNVLYFKSYIPIFLLNKNLTLLDILKNEKFDREFFAKYKEQLDKLNESNICEKYADFIFNSCEI